MEKPSADKDRPVPFKDIIPTGFLTAYPRALTDIPYAKQLYQGFTNIAAQEGIEPPANHQATLIAEGIQLRYALIDDMMARHPSKQVLEIAAGLSPRGLAAVSHDASVCYSEIDLPEMAALKQAAIQTLSEIPDNLQIHGGNALDAEDIASAVEHFDELQPVTVINEGLLGYLSFGEKRQLAKNIRQLLKKAGGVWITSDVVARPQSKNDVKERDKVLSRQLFSPDVFTTEHEFVAFFSELGLDIHIHQAQLGKSKDHLGAYNKVAVLTVRGASDHN